ncbi:MAG: metal ABC transporter substrate-binding protein [Dehalococcoidia bacterium]
MKLKYFLNFTILCISMLIVACTTADDSSASDSNQVTVEESSKYSVIASTPMIGEFVKQVAKDSVDVHILMPYQVNPHNFEATAKDVIKLNNADLVFFVGIKYESAGLLKLLENASKSEAALVEIGSKVDPIEFKEEDDHDDHGGHEGHEGHGHGLYDPHFWFDPTKVELAVKEIAAQLINLDPDNQNAYQSSSDAYISELRALDQELNDLIQSVPSDNRKMITTHEALGYLEARYGIEIVGTVIPSFSTEEGVAPKDLTGVIEKIKEHDMKIMFLESESPSKGAEVVAQETGVRLVSGLWVETLRSADESYADFLRSNVNIIVDNLKQ